MAASTMPDLERPPLYAPLRRHPWLPLSLAAHLLLAASLYTAGPVRVEFKRDDDVRVHVEQSLRQTERRDVQRQLRQMEEIKEALEQSAGVPSKGGDARAAVQDPVARARQLAASIEAVQQQVRATEMARLLKIPEQDALERVRAEAARLPKPKPARTEPPEATVARLASQARAALTQRRAQLLAQQQGTAVQPGKRAPGDGRASGSARERGTAGPGGGKNAAAGSGGAKGDGGGRGGGGDNTGMSSASAGSCLEALARGLEMGPPGALTGSSLDMSSSAFSDTRGYGGYLAPPPLDAARVRPGLGRALGAGGPFASRVVLDTWYVIGPFEGHGGDSQQAVYPPERGIDLDAVYYGKNELPVRWTWQQDGSYPSVPRPRAENAVYYAYTEVMVDEDVDLWAWIGADDDSKMWFNERLVWISSRVDDKPWYRQPFYRQRTAVATRNLSEGQRRLHFHKGRNTILFKLYNGVNLMFYSVVLST